MSVGFADQHKGIKEVFQMEKDISSLEDTRWRCQYHVVFAPKYRRMGIYGEIKEDIGYILRKLCEQKGVEIIEAEACPDHIHMLLSIPPKYSVSQIMGYLKGKSSLMIFDRHTRSVKGTKNHAGGTCVGDRYIRKRPQSVFKWENRQDR